MEIIYVISEKHATTVYCLLTPQPKRGIWLKPSTKQAYLRVIPSGCCALIQALTLERQSFASSATGPRKTRCNSQASEEERNCNGSNHVSVRDFSVSIFHEERDVYEYTPTPQRKRDKAK